MDVNYYEVKPIAVIEFEAIAPLWPGGPLGGTTYRCIGRSCIGPFLPDSKQLVGRIRWLLRTVEASIKVLNGKRINSYREVDELASRIFGTTQSASKVRILLEYDWNSVKNYASLNDVNAIWDEALKHLKRNSRRIPDYLEEKGFNLLRQHYGLSKTLGKRSELRDCLALFTIPRIRLAIQGSKKPEDVYEKLPLKPNAKVTVRVYPRVEDILSDIEKEVLVHAIIFTMVFIGLGKATTRGFGHFRYIVKDSRVEVNPRQTSMSNCEEAIRVFKNLGEKLIEYSSKLLGYDHEEILKKIREIDDVREHDEDVLWKRIGELVKLSRVPLFITALILSERYCIDDLKHPCPYATRELTRASLPGCTKEKIAIGKSSVSYDIKILYALSAVGKATLKSTWKLYHQLHGMGVNLRDPGVAYHTWPLGLPRGIIKKRNGVTKEVTGYHLWREPFAEETCWNLDKNREFPIEEDVRRVSMMIFTVMCSENRCSALIEPFLSYQDFKHVGNRLVHIGKHDEIVHIVNVFYAAKKESLGVDRVNNCPQDRSGVAEPEKVPGLRIAQDPILDPMRVSLKWLRSLLG